MFDFLGRPKGVAAFAAASAIAIVASTSSAFAQEQERQFNIPAQPLSSALLEFSRQADVLVISDTANLDGRRAPAVVGTFAPSEALSRLLAGSGLSVEPRADGGFVLADTSSPTRLGAADRAVPSDSADEEEIVVVGTNIRGQAPVGAPVIVFNREAIQDSGRGRIQDFLETVPQNFAGSGSESATRFFNGKDIGAANDVAGQAVDLRGLGASSTLVLVNGRRPPLGGLQGSFVDISSISSSAVERIELLTDGASALYGSDAIGGVVNFVLRRDYEGLELTGRVGTTDGAAEEYQASILAGRNWSRANLLLGYQYSHRDALFAADAHYSGFNRDYRALGGSDLRAAFGNPGTILSPTNQPAFAIPEGQDGTNLTVADLIPGRNYQDTLGAAVVPEQTLNSIFGVGQFALNESLELFAEVRASRREMTFPFFSYVAALTVPSTNPYYVNPFSTSSVRVHYDFGNDLGGPSIYNSATDTYVVTLGLRAQIGSDWELNGSVTNAHERSDWAWHNIANGLRRNACLSGLSSSPCPGAPLNVFGDHATNDPGTIDYIRSVDFAFGEYTSQSATAIADGSVFSLPAGAARLALGADYRYESLEAENGNFAPATGVTTLSTSLTVGSVDRRVGALFGELVLPVIGETQNIPGVQNLRIMFAGRYENYSDFGTTTNPKIGLDWMPVEGLSLRGSWGTSFRAPRFNEVSTRFNPPFAATVVGVADPASPTGFSTILQRSGNNADIGPETATTWTAGADFQPSVVPGLSLSLTYFDVAYEDKIEGGPSNAIILANPAQWAPLIVRNPTQAQIDAICNSPEFDPVNGCPASAISAIVDRRLRNLGGVNVQGIDFNASYSMDLGSGSLNLGVSGVYTLTYERAASRASPFVSVLDTVTNPLDLRLRVTAGWVSDNWAVNGAVSFADDYDDPVRNRSVSSWTTVDLGARYQFGGADDTRGPALRFSVVNLFDQEPPFVNITQGFDYINASEVGRSFSVTLEQRW